MHQGDGGGAGPFAYYPASADAIRDTAADVANRAADIGSVRRQVEADHRRALTGVGGALTDPMARVPDALVANADRVEQAALFAAGVVRLFADAVDDYTIIRLGLGPSKHSTWRTPKPSSMTSGSTPTHTRRARRRRIATTKRTGRSRMRNSGDL
jgi:hypothetical protein